MRKFLINSILSYEVTLYIGTLKMYTINILECFHILVLEVCVKTETHNGVPSLGLGFIKFVVS